jgi:hypothetical protein
MPLAAHPMFISVLIPVLKYGIIIAALGVVSNWFMSNFLCITSVILGHLNPIPCLQQRSEPQGCHTCSKPPFTV